MKKLAIILGLIILAALLLIFFFYQSALYQKSTRFVSQTLPVTPAALPPTKPATAPPVKSASLYDHDITVGGNLLHVQVAATQPEWSQGLSGREGMEQNQGMLFDMRGVAPVQPGYWMKNMKFGLDFIWIHYGRVVGITPNVALPPPGTPEKALTIYYPDLGVDVDTVLETNAGWNAAHKIKLGDKVQILTPY